MAIILNIETSTTNCSVSIADSGVELYTCSLNDGYKHSERLMPFIEEVFLQSRFKKNQIDAIAVSEGPGSYTGLRIGVSVAKGLCYALDKPLITLNSLEIMTFSLLRKGQLFDVYLPMIDARRMEVYTAAYTHELNCLQDVSALVMDENSFNTYSEDKSVAYFGDGANKCVPIFSHRKNFLFVKDVVPSSIDMCDLSFSHYQNGNFKSTAYFEPNYLKEFHIQTK